jgi:polysaccharide biosynthesis/export protein
MFHRVFPLPSILFVIVPTAQSVLAQSPRPVPGSFGEAQCAGYRLGPQDQMVVRGLNGERMNETVTVAGDGSITLPLAGRISVSGKKTEEVQRDLHERLKTFIREPNVSVSITAAQSRHISVIGAVNQPGVHVIRGCSRLIDAISEAGGLRQDAGNTIKVTRNRPTPTRTDDDARTAGTVTGSYEIADIRLSDLIEARRPEANILVEADDVISVPRAQLIYVVGAVQKAGGFVLNERETFSVLQVLSLAGGLAPTPAPEKSRVIRAGGSGEKTEIAVDVRDILNGKHADVTLQPDDILFIPSSATKKAALRTVEAVIQAATGIAIWRR